MNALEFASCICQVIPKEIFKNPHDLCEQFHIDNEDENFIPLQQF